MRHCMPVNAISSGTGLYAYSPRPLVRRLLVRRAITQSFIACGPQPAGLRSCGLSLLSPVCGQLNISQQGTMLFDRWSSCYLHQ